jgi:hypothetical protein
MKPDLKCLGDGRRAERGGSPIVEKKRGLRFPIPEFHIIGKMETGKLSNRIPVDFGLLSPKSSRMWTEVAVC